MENTKTGLNTDKLIETIKSSVDFWTSTVQHFCFERVRKIRCVGIFEFVLQLAKNRSDGSQNILDAFCIHHNIPGGNVLKSSMSEARDNVIINMWQQVLFDIGKELRTQIKTRRYFAIDGTVIALQNAKFGGKFKKAYGSYLPHGFGSMLYDIDYGFPIDVLLEESLNERSAALKHLTHLRTGDVVVMDRGYYSKDLYNAFTEKGVHVIFRMRSNTLKKEWNNSLEDFLSKQKNKQGDEVDCRFIKYTKNDTQYMLMTSLIDKNADTIELVEAVYNNRWNIETAYGYVKESCSLTNLHARTTSHLQQEFYANFLLLTFSRILEFHSLNSSKHKIVGGIFKRNVVRPLNSRKGNDSCDYKVNFKKCISLVDKCLHDVLSTNIKSTFDYLTQFIMKDLSAIRPNRNFPRINISPVNNWQLNRNVVVTVDG